MCAALPESLNMSWNWTCMNLLWTKELVQWHMWILNWMWILHKTVSSVASPTLVCLMAPDVGLGDAGSLLRMVEQIPATNAHLDWAAQSCELQGTAGSTTPLNDAGVRSWWGQSLGAANGHIYKELPCCLSVHLQQQLLFFPPMHSFCNVYISL